MQATMAESQNSEKSRHREALEVAANVNRSLADLEKSLKEKCLECIIEYATFLRDTSATKVQFSSFSPLLRRDILKKLESTRDQNQFGCISTEDIERVFSLLQLTLDESVTEFSFEVFEDWFEMHKETFRMLADRCPDLVTIKDPSCLQLTQFSAVWPDLQRLRSLEHIKLNCYVCSLEDLEQLAATFPNLRSLAVTFLEDDFDDKMIYSFQNLEHLWINVHSNFTRGKTRDENKILLEDVLAECLRRLPLLEVAHVKFIPHNSVIQPKEPLALTNVRLECCLHEWCSDLLPKVTNLILEGPLRNPKAYLGFTNLIVMHLSKVSGEHVMAILRTLRGTLEDLVLTRCPAEPYELFRLCPRLTRLHWQGAITEGGGADLHPVDASNFRRLRSVRLELERFPADLLKQVLMAPELKEISVEVVDLGEPEEILSRLQRREIMQHLRKINFQRVTSHFPHYVALYEALVTSAPRLRTISFYAHEGQVPHFLDDLNIPGLEVSIMEHGEW